LFEPAERGGFGLVGCLVTLTQSGKRRLSEGEVHCVVVILSVCVFVNGMVYVFNHEKLWGQLLSSSSIPFSVFFTNRTTKKKQK